MKKLYDVSLPLYPGMVVWEDHPPLRREEVKSIARGMTSNVSFLGLSTHTGTHVDAPRHFIEGAAGVDRLDPQLLVGIARLFSLEGIGEIDHPHIERLDLAGVARVLFRTDNSARWREEARFRRDFVSLTAPAARLLVERGVRLVGVDYLSVEAFGSPGRPTHHALLEAGVVIVEGLDLSGVPLGDYELLCLPLKIRDGDGAPARVFLREL